MVSVLLTPIWEDDPGLSPELEQISKSLFFWRYPNPLLTLFSAAETLPSLRCQLYMLEHELEGLETKERQRLVSLTQKQDLPLHDQEIDPRLPPLRVRVSNLKLALSIKVHHSIYKTKISVLTKFSLAGSEVERYIGQPTNMFLDLNLETLITPTWTEPQLGKDSKEHSKELTLTYDHRQPTWFLLSLAYVLRARSRLLWHIWTTACTVLRLGESCLKLFRPLLIRTSGRLLTLHAYFSKRMCRSSAWD